MSRTGGALLLALITACCVRPAVAEPEPAPGVLSVHFDNDYFLDTDQNYTSGFRLAYVAPMAPSHPLAPLARALQLGDGDTRITYSLGQKIFTPQDISQTQLITTDQPYSAYLYGGIAIESEKRRENDRRILENVELQIGVVGPHAYGEEVQKLAHSLFGSDEPKGWDNQLNDELAVNLYYDRVWGGWYGTRIGPADGNYRLDFSPHVGAALGNVYTHLSAGGTLRLGQNLPPHDGPPSIRPGPPGTDYYKPTPDLRWYLFVGMDGRAVARNIFLDGNTFTDSHSIDKEGLVGEMRFGLAVLLGRYRLTYARVNRSEEFEGQASNRFGSLTLSVAF
jgi:hypothetical protein